MVTILSVPTRFGGELAINRSDIKAMQSGRALSSITTRLQHIWDRIKDWFCNTSLVEAKQHLSVLYNPDASTREKSDSYFRLMVLVGEGYRDRFEVRPEAFGFSTMINYGADVTPYSHSIVLCNHDYLLAQMEEDVAKASVDPELLARYQRELIQDLPRARFSIAGENIKDIGAASIGGAGNLANFHTAIADALSPTAKQFLAIDTLCYQKIFALLLLSSLGANGGQFFNDTIHIKGAGDIIFDFSTRGDDVELHANFSSDWQSDIPGRSSLLQAPVYDVRLLIGPKGELTLLSAVVGASPLPQ